MRKVTKILLKALSVTVLFLIFCPIVLTLLVSLPSVQNFVVDRAVKYLSRKLETTVSIDRIRLGAWGSIRVDGFYVEDYQKDTLLYVGRLQLHMAGLRDNSAGIVLRNGEVSNTKLYLRETPEGVMNIKQVMDRLSNKEKKGGGDFGFGIRNVQIDDFTLIIERQEHRDPEYGIDYNDMHLEHTSALIEGFMLRGSMIGGYIRNFSTTEHSGFRIDNFTGRFLVDRGLIDLRDFEIDTEESAIRLSSLVLRGEDWSSYKDFVHNVAIDGELYDTSVSTDDIAHFAPGLLPWKLAVKDMNVSVSGSVADMNVDVSNISFGEHSLLSTDVSLRGLPDVAHTTMTVDLRRLMTCEADVARLSAGIGGSELPEKIRSIMSGAGEMICAGRFEGGIRSFATDLKLTTQAGNAAVSLKRRPLKREAGDTLSRYAVTASADVRHLRLGRLLQNPDLGPASASLRFDGVMADGGGVDGNVNGEVESVEWMGCRYDSLSLNGRILNKSFTGTLRSDCAPLRMMLSGKADMNGTEPVCDVRLVVDRADLHAMNINRRDSISTLALGAELYAVGNWPDSMNGTLSLGGEYVYESDTLRSGDVKITARSSEGRRSVSLTSDFADATFTGPTSYGELAKYLESAMSKYLPSLYGSGVREYVGPDGSSGYSTLAVTVKELDPLLNAISEGLQLAPGSKFNFILNPSDNVISMRAESDYLERGRLLATRLKMNMVNQGDSLALYLTSEDLYAGGMHTPQLTVMGGAKNDRMHLSAGFDDPADSLSGMLSLWARVGRDSTGMRRVTMSVLPSTVSQGGQNWRISSDEISIDTARVVVNDFMIRTDNQMLHVDGVASRSRSDSLTLRLNNFDISSLAGFAMGMGYDVEGRSNGTASMKSALYRGELTSDIGLDDVTINGIAVPPLQLDSRWDFERQRVRILINNRTTGDNIIRGYYAPSTGRYYAEARIEDMNMSLLDPILSGVVSGTSGTATAMLEISGQNREASMAGSIEVRDLATTVDFTQARYTVPNATIEVEDNHLRASNVRVYDSEQNGGLLTMDLNLQHTSNISYVMRVMPRKMIVLNTTSRDNDLFYGKVYASGVATISGSKKGATLDIVASTEGNSQFFMPLSSKTDVSTADFVIFEKPGMQLDTMNYLERKKLMFERRNSTRTTGGSTMNINIELTANPNAEVQLVIDPTVGDIIKVRGDGTLNMRIVPSANIFDMYGDYTITEGSYLFTLQNIINKLFIIEEGSTIQWTGDPMDARLDIDAVYKLKASLKPLLSSTTLDNISRAVPVECIINLSDRLTNPSVTFDIKVPNADSEIQNAVANLLNNQQSIATQFMYLLVSASFYSDSSTSSSIGASASAATGFELLSNQLSNWLSSDDYNIVLRYRPRSELTSDEIDFGFSKSLVSDRLIVELEGNYLIDNQMSANSNMSNFLGEAYITWLIDENGNLKLKGFTQTIDRFDENQGLQETGVGIYYKEDFENWKDLKRRVRDRFMSKRRREQRDAEMRETAERSMREADSLDKSGEGMHLRRDAAGRDTTSRAAGVDTLHRAAVNNVAADSMSKDSATVNAESVEHVAAVTDGRASKRGRRHRQRAEAAATMDAIPVEDNEWIEFEKLE